MAGRRRNRGHTYTSCGSCLTQRVFEQAGVRASSANHLTCPLVAPRCTVLRFVTSLSLLLVLPRHNVLSQLVRAASNSTAVPTLFGRGSRSG